MCGQPCVESSTLTFAVGLPPSASRASRASATPSARLPTSHSARARPNCARATSGSFGLSAVKIASARSEVGDRVGPLLFGELDLRELGVERRGRVGVIAGRLGADAERALERRVSLGMAAEALLRVGDALEGIRELRAVLAVRGLLEDERALEICEAMRDRRRRVLE